MCNIWKSVIINHNNNSLKKIITRWDQQMKEKNHLIKSNTHIHHKNSQQTRYRQAFPQLHMLLSRFSLIRLCATPWTAAHQAPPTLGFSRQEHWSELPFPPPMHESGKWKWSRSVVSCQEAFNRRLPVCCFGSVRNPLFLINSWIFRN